ncbi:hypothetical protein [Streptomyces sp. NPDC020965]|uniref:hypothetical protein n=1 Tax=Streptomyces sp. NPDC020965 TaxID=3365105 RepID=UPI0037BD4652
MLSFRGLKLLASGIVGVLVALLGMQFAFASDTPVQAAAAEPPPFIVEEYAHPGAERFKATRGITLKKGDGRVVMAECDQSLDQIRILTVADSTVGREETYCFRATAKSGYLSLELPRVFALESGTHPFSADLTANGRETTVNVPKDGFEPVGEGAVGGARSVLVEIRVTG